MRRNMVQAVDANGVQDMAAKLRASVQNVIVGKDEVIDLAIIA